MADNNKEYLVQEQDEGMVMISEEVICTIAAAAVMEVEGVENLCTNIGSDLAEMLGMRNLGKSMKLTVDGKNVALECAVVLAYGYDVLTVAKNIQQNVTTSVESMTGFKVSKVDVSVNAVSAKKK